MVDIKVDMMQDGSYRIALFHDEKVIAIKYVDFQAEIPIGIQRMLLLNKSYEHLNKLPSISHIKPATQPYKEKP